MSKLDHNTLDYKALLEHLGDSCFISNNDFFKALQHFNCKDDWATLSKVYNILTSLGCYEHAFSRGSDLAVIGLQRPRSVDYRISKRYK